jgi:predicted glycoside hydrolase/deacetylase ChbG (UPF0249 family)
MTRNLIVTADDVALHPGLTEGAIRAHREGIVTACSIVANGEAFDDAVARLRDVPSLEKGVHLTLVDEKPLTPGIRFPKRWTGFAFGWARMSGGSVERELRAQVERVLGAGLKVTHLNGHQHLHVMPGIFRIVERIARDYGIGYVRIPAEIRLSGGVARRLSVGILRMLARRAGEGRTIGISEAGHLDREAILRLLRLVPDGVTELVTHPGIDDGTLARRYAWNYEWDRETTALCDPAVRAALADLDIHLIHPQ